MRRLAPLILAALLVLSAGCGGSSDETTGGSVPAGGGKVSVDDVRAAWERNPECERPDGASRWGCSVGAYRCQGVVSDRGWTISCSKSGASLAFRVRPS
ncbi:MAG TPA: hypothetical protein VNR67_03670 [Solirubrobacterales bacterium]|nr:hypothetical protein [Solirubrobacterales bacterium]